MSYKKLFLKFSRNIQMQPFLLYSTKATNSFTIQVVPFERIPGPKHYRLFGPLNDVVTIGDPKNLHKTIHKLHESYGPIFRIKLGKTDSIFTSSSEYMRAIFRYEGKYPKHPLPPAWVYFNKKYNCKRGLFFMDDNEWLQYRKVLNPMLLQNFSHYKLSIETACDKLIDGINDDDNIATNSQDKKLRDTEFVQWWDLETRLYRWSIDVVINVMLGTINDKIIPHTLIEEFSEVVHKIFEYSVKLQTIPPQLADFLKIKAWTEFGRVVNRTLQLGNKIIDEAIEHCPRDSDGLMNQFKDKNIGKDDIKRLFTDLIIAAGDTTSFATQWALYLVAKNTEVQKSIQKSLIDPQNMEAELIRGAVRETLRLYPPATFIGRITQETGIIGSYQIPEGTLALLSLYTAGRDPNHFSHPYDFTPERWTRNSNLHHACNPLASLPYAIGARSCIGRKIANYQMHALLTKLLLKYDMKLINEYEVDSVMKMVITPAEPIRIGLKLKRNV